MNRFSLAKYNIKYKTVLLRVDHNVPLENDKIKDNNKIKSTLPTINYLLQENCKIIIATHLGRPEGKFNEKLKTDVLAKELENLVEQKVIKLNDSIGKDIKQKITESDNRLFMLENLRFYKEEEDNDQAFAHSLAELAEVYVNDAFAVCHRKHASVAAITKFLPSIAGILVEKEIMELSKALTPERPAVWILGGAKLKKVNFIEKSLEKADFVLIGGALAFSFLKAKGLPVGNSKIDYESEKNAKKIMTKENSRKIILPTDLVVAETINNNAKTEVIPVHMIQPEQIGLDIGPDSIELFKRYLRKAKTIVWNGPLGYFELAKFSTSTKEIGRLLGKLTATTICGGGETTEAIRKFHLEHNFTHLSTGGGATVAFLSGQKLPAITALEENYSKFK